MNKFWGVERFDDSRGGLDWVPTDDIFFKSRENAVEYAVRWNAKVRRDWCRKVEGAQVGEGPVVGEVRVVEVTFQD